MWRGKDQEKMKEVKLFLLEQRWNHFSEITQEGTDRENLSVIPPN